MTVGWVVFGLVMPAIVAGVGWLAALANERHLHAQDAKRTRPAEQAGGAPSPVPLPT